MDSSGTVYSDTVLETGYAGNEPAGMTITVSCCATSSTPNDDAAVIDYASICNSSSRTVAGLSSLVAAVVVSLYWLI
jgi:hypothetical protein